MLAHDERAIEALKDHDLWDQAVNLDPPLFAALAIAGGVEANRFPLSTTEDLDAVMGILIGDADSFRTRAVGFTRQDARDHFPDEFFPIADRADLLKKAYLSIVGAHAAAERVRLEAFRVSPSEFKASHTMPEEGL